MASPAINNEPMPGDATRSKFLVASGFGIGSLLLLGAFLYLIGVGAIDHEAVSPATPAAQSAANAPTAPGPAPKPAPNTGGSTVRETTGSAPAPANADTPQAPTTSQQQ